MKLNFSNKKLIIVLILILLLIAGGVFWWKHPKSQLRKWWIEEIEMRGSVRDFSIRETPEGKIVENKKEGLMVKVPDGWQAEKAETVFFSTWGVYLSSPDIKTEPPYFKKGCMIEINIERSNVLFNVAKTYIRNVEKVRETPTLEENGFEIIQIAQKQALKQIVYNSPKIGISLEVRIPIQKDKNIYFVLNSSFEDKNKCFQEFDNLLETVSINK